MPQATIDNQEQTATCATCPYFQPHDDGTNKGWCKLFNHFARENHQQTQDCVNNISDEQAVAQAELDQHIEEQARRFEWKTEDSVRPHAAQELAPEFEVDSDLDAEFGILYRVWFSYHLLGTFYQNLDGFWISQPCNSDERLTWHSDLQAIDAILAA